MTLARPLSLLRAILFEFYFVTLTLVLGLGGVVLRLSAPHRALDYARFWIRLTLGGLRVICGIRYVVHGREHLPANSAALLASQHQSVFDTLVWFLIVPRPAYVMKQELRRIPLFGPLLEPAGMIPVDRGGGAAALRGLLQATVRAAAEARTLIIFPEGTRVAPGNRVPLQPGIAAVAAGTSLPVLPVATDSGLHWGRKFLHKRAGTIHIAIGPALPAGLKRQILLSEIDASWQRLGRFVSLPPGGQAVDNFVDDYGNRQDKQAP